MNKLNITIETKEQRDEVIKQLQEMTFKKELPKSLEIKEGWYAMGNEVRHTRNITSSSINKPNLYATEKQAKSALVKAQLSQLMKVYNDGWVADWDKSFQEKYIIYRSNDELDVDTHGSWYMFLSFKDKETRDIFLKNFKPLIRTYFELD